MTGTPDLVRVALATSITALVATSLVMPLVRALLVRRGVVDTANHRSSHVGSVPRGGGLAIGIGGAVATGATVAFDVTLAWVPIAYIAAHLLLGAAEDFWGVPILWRLIVQVTAALALVNATPLEIERIYGPVVLLITALALVGVVNAFNFMDGINGISAFTAIVGSTWFLFLGMQNDAVFLVLLAALVLGASLAFVPWNVPRAALFLGDSGSYALGASFGTMMLLAISAGSGVVESCAPLFIYVLDTAWTLFRRIQRGASWHNAHREHVYQRLSDRSRSHWRVSLGVAVAVAGSILVVAGADSALLEVILLLGVGLLYLSSPSWIRGSA